MKITNFRGNKMQTIPINKINQYQSLRKEEEEIYKSLNKAKDMTTQGEVIAKWSKPNPRSDSGKFENVTWAEREQYAPNLDFELKTKTNIIIKKAFIETLENELENIRLKIDDILITVEDKNT